MVEDRIYCFGTHIDVREAQFVWVRDRTQDA
jgi:hypothetical protein